MLRIISAFFERDRLDPEQLKIVDALIEWGVPEKAANLLGALEAYRLSHTTQWGVKVYKLAPHPNEAGKVQRISNSTPLPDEIEVGEESEDRLDRQEIVFDRWKNRGLD